MTSRENLGLFRIRTVPLERRNAQAQKYFGASNRIFKLYVAGYMKHEVGGRELVELIGSLMRTIVVTHEFMEELLNDINVDDSTGDAREQRHDEMNRGLAIIVAGGLQILTEHNRFRESISSGWLGT